MVALEHSRDSRIATVILNRPNKRNALNQLLIQELTSVIHSLSADSHIRVIVLTGSGNVFSAGADLDDLRQMQSASYEHNIEDSRRLSRLFQEITCSPKLLVAKINGHAIAGGCGLAAVCDVSFAVESALLGFSEVRIGFVPALVTVLLRDRLPGTQLRNLMLGGQLVPAREAQAMGLITNMVPDSDLESTVALFSESICRNTSPEAISRTKSLLAESSSMSLAEAISLAEDTNARARLTPDCMAGVAAFLDKTDAPWVQAFDSDRQDPA